jgi:hypothetical protein
METEVANHDSAMCCSPYPYLLAEAHTLQIFKNPANYKALNKILVSAMRCSSIALGSVLHRKLVQWSLITVSKEQLCGLILDWRLWKLYARAQWYWWD